MKSLKQSFKVAFITLLFSIAFGIHVTIITTVMELNLFVAEERGTGR